ncbi:MAG: PASTA domain-containing protein, partial [Chlorobiaceae bacterium]|nr:PASTA domain-containing protein [Chlorobiaceae bacterium]
MRKTLLTWCLAWLIAMLQSLELQALGRDNMALIGASNTVAQIDGTSPARTLMRPVLTPVPDLAGMSLNDARAALLEANLRVGQVTSAESRSEP